MEDANELRHRCSTTDLNKEKYKDDALWTETADEQVNVENSVDQLYTAFRSRLKDDPDIPVLERGIHRTFLWKGLKSLSGAYECLDASRPWLCYWIVHSLEILEELIPEDIAVQVVQFLGKCQSPSGGFGGGPQQLPHLAPTYAAVNALCILSLSTDEAFKIINRKTLYEYLLSMRSPDGSFRMHKGGEVDIRGAYCAACVATLTHISTPELFKDTPQWLAKCQSYEGGFSGCPGQEAHGGYSFCGLAALILIGGIKHCDIKNLLRWTANRQMRFEGGFQGRTNKLVDGCYSFWQGGAFPLFHMVLCSRDDDHLSAERWMFHQDALQEYLLICCQHPGGGLIDKPGKSRDFYHTCYCLSGLSVAQHFTGGHLAEKYIIGSPKNEVKPIHPVYNIGIDAVVQANQYFNNLPKPGNETEHNN
ncbi:protein farnesyltransferase subunit beta-like [Gigantopelta aegis]|uniref:protein farnesyltransferase subunit beta-like n=1 Tax=Gigantopelta aegis TaxID=1735272 RepID=UPI001B8884BB|nr:protein farnesyltransferase subunit beta-like [Gigantopelta aegis]